MVAMALLFSAKTLVGKTLSPHLRESFGFDISKL